MGNHLAKKNCSLDYRPLLKACETCGCKTKKIDTTAACNSGSKREKGKTTRPESHIKVLSENAEDGMKTSS